MPEINKVVNKKQPYTPQNLLHNAAYHLNQGELAVASECLWLCGSLALKRYSQAVNNGGDKTKGRKKKDKFIDKIVHEYGKEIRPHWNSLSK